MRPGVRRAVGAFFPLAIVGSATLLVARAAGAGIGVPWLVVAGLVLVSGAVVAAGLAAYAFVRREPWWGILLLVAWPVVVPLYVGSLRRRSGESDR